MRRAGRLLLYPMRIHLRFEPGALPGLAWPWAEALTMLKLLALEPHTGGSCTLEDLAGRIGRARLRLRGNPADLPCLLRTEMPARRRATKQLRQLEVAVGGA